MTPSFDVLTMRLGEKDGNGVERGIHWHASKDVDVSYVSSDGRRTIERAR